MEDVIAIENYFRYLRKMISDYFLREKRLLKIIFARQKYLIYRAFLLVFHQQRNYHQSPDMLVQLPS
jgi:hypothetical protein